MEKKVWYITGASKGLGLALIKKLLAEGHRVAATSRILPTLVDAVEPASDDFLPLEVDPSDETSVEASLKQTWNMFGRIDVVVNNAGYGTDIFTPMTVIQKVMPYLRAQEQGHIINISSIAGFAGVTGWPVYASAKCALISMSETLARDTRELGIYVTAVAPGAFRTQFFSKDRTSHARYLSIDGKQIGDPVKAAAALMQIASMAEPPTLIFLGSDAYSRATAKMAELSEQIERYQSLSPSTAYEN